MKTIFTLSFILISLIGYSQDQTQNYVKKDPLTLGIEITTMTLKTRDEIEQKIEEYNRRLEGLFMEREEWVKLLDQCDKLQIVTPKDTVGQQVSDEVLRSIDPKIKTVITGSTVTKLHFNEVGDKLDASQFKASGEIKKKTKKAQK